MHPSACIKGPPHTGQAPVSLISWLVESPVLVFSGVEAGASVYSASKIAHKEFPDLDASMRGNISIARRLLDPLAELVKIDPKSIGVGLYQHDVNQKKLAESLHAVVESAVNLVGVDLNTASASLLQYVSGLNSRMAENIVKYREDNVENVTLIVMLNETEKIETTKSDCESGRNIECIFSLDVSQYEDQWE